MPSSTNVNPSGKTVDALGQRFPVVPTQIFQRPREPPVWPGGSLTFVGSGNERGVFLHFLFALLIGRPPSAWQLQHRCGLPLA